ncbi:hypothetical protein GCM10023087_35790 [Microbacterium rhizosphaerae]
MTTTTAALNVADLGIAVSSAAADSTLVPPVQSSSSNISATAVGLPISVATNTETAPPDAGPVVGGIAASVTGLIDIGAITTTNEAHWSLPTACTTTGVLSAATTQVASLGVLPALDGGILSLGVSQSKGTTSLVQNSGLNYGIQSVGSGTVSGLSVLGGAVTIDVQGNSTLTATASGTSAGATAYVPATVQVTDTATSTTTTLTVGGNITIDVLGVGSVTVTMNTPTSTTTATSATTSVSLLTVDVRVPAAPLPAVTSATVDVLPLHAAATAPAGGIDCPPPAPVITAPTSGQVTGDSTPAVTGTAVAGATVNVDIDNGAQTGTATADGSGSWTFTPSTPLAEGAHTVSATQTVAGTTGPATADVPFTVDTTPPPAPVVVTPADGSSTNDTTPAISGTAEPNSTVTVSIDGSPLEVTATADGSGNWTLIAPTLDPGSYTVDATTTDAAGNVSPVSNTNTFTVDTTPPPAPVVVTPADGSSTNDTTPAISGTAEPGSTVTVSIDGTPLGTTTTADGSGNWTLTAPTLTAGPHTVNATSTDAAGNVSPVSNTNTFTIDTTPPPAPVVVTPADGSSTNDTTPTISGTAEPNSTVSVSIDGAPPLGTTATTDGAGNWTLTAPTLTPGPHTVNATATDAAGNVSPVSNTNTFTIDTTAPPAPVVVTPVDGSSTNNPTPPISGTAEANTTVTVSIDGTPLGTTATTDGSGNWVLASPVLTPGTHTVNATAADAAGNVSAVSNTNTFTIDTTPPTAPIVLTPANGSSTSDTTPMISGLAEPDSTVTVSIDGSPLGTTTTTDGSGNWTLTAPTLTPGSHTVSATATDAAGNISAPSSTNTFTIDTTPPAAPVIVSPADGAILTTNQPPITGTAEANSTVSVIIDGSVAGTATADGSGNWTFTPPAPLSEGGHTVVATATDAAGNVSPQSNQVSFTVDTVPPAAPVITSPANGSTTSDATPPVTGTAEPGSTVTVIIDGSAAGTTTADGEGDWTFTPTTPLSDGTHTISATATDAAGHVGPAASPVTVTIAGVATPPVPTAPSGTLPTTGGEILTAGWLVGSILIGMGVFVVMIARRRVS